MKFEDAVAEIKRRVDIATIVGRHVRLKKTGHSWTGLCPFHEEKTGSFNVRSDKGTFKCFGCGVSGDVFSFIELKTGQLFADIVRKLASDLGIKIESTKTPFKQSVEENRDRLLAALEKAQTFFKSNLLTPERENQALAYLLKERGLGVDDIDKQGLGFAGQNDKPLIDFLTDQKVDLNDAIASGLIRPGRQGNYSFFSKRVTIPIRDHRGRIVAFAGRWFGPEVENRPKYINSPASLVYEKSQLLYGLWESLPSLKQGLPAVLVEGYFDVMAIRKLDVPAVAPCGTSLTEEHVHLLSRYTKSVLLCFDRDAAGRAAQKKALMLLLKNGFHVRAVELSGKDPDSVVLEGKGEELKRSLMQAKDAIEVLCREVSRISIFGMSERIAALEALLPYLAASPSQLVNRQYVKLAARILGEEERILIKEVAKISPEILAKETPKIVVQTEPKRTKRLSWTFSEKLLARALLANPTLALKIESSIRHELNFELADFIDRLVQLLSRYPEKDPKSQMHLIPVPRDSEWVNMLLENARHGDIVSQEDGEKILDDLRRRNERVLALEEMSLEHADLTDAENRGDMVMVHKVLSAQTVRLKKMDKSAKEAEKLEFKPQEVPSAKENDFSEVLDDFDELRWT